MPTQATHSSSSPTDMIAEVLSQSLGGAFDSIKEKVTANITENGEQYLMQAVERIKESTTSLVEWAKENPMKTALAVAALAAVSTFLVHTMTTGTQSKADKAPSAPAKAKTAVKSAKRA